MRGGWARVRRSDSLINNNAHRATAVPRHSGEKVSEIEVAGRTWTELPMNPAKNLPAAKTL